MQIIVFLVCLAATPAFAQSNVRGTAAGTQEHAVIPLRTEPRVGWEVKPRYRDSSALVVSGTVLVTGNINGTGGTFAYDTATGKQLWSIPGHMRGQPAVDATAAYAVNDVKKANRFRLNKLDLRTGKVLWSAEEEDLGNHDAAPVIAGAQLVLTSRSSVVSGYDLATGKLLWQHTRVRICEPPLSFADGLVYFSGGLTGTEHTLTALDPTTGTTVWGTLLTGESRGCGTVTAVAAGTLVTGLGNDLIALDAKSGKTRWTRMVAPTVAGRKQPLALSQLVIADGVIYSASSTHILGWDLASGRQTYEFALPVTAELSTIVLTSAGGVLFIHANGPGSTPGSRGAAILYALDRAAKKILWQHQVSRPDQYDKQGSWPTRFILPVDNAVYYENQQLLVKLVP